MTNPFPGMDPVIEQRSVWPGFHNTFIGQLRGSINRDLPDRYAATIEHRLELSTDGDAAQVIADVSISERDGSAGLGGRLSRRWMPRGWSDFPS